jgi:hypothetical protein
MGRPPSVKQLDADGKPRLNANGKPLWTAVIEFRDKATRERFGDQVLEALRQTHPEVFTESGQ